MSYAVLMASVSVAIAALVMFFHAVEEDVKFKRPFVKFMCIKAIISILYFQDMIVDALFSTGIIKVDPELTSLYEIGIQQSLNVVEMGLIFSFAFAHAYDPKEYRDSNDNIKLRDKQFIRFIKKNI